MILNIISFPTLYFIGNWCLYDVDDLNRPHHFVARFLEQNGIVWAQSQHYTCQTMYVSISIIQRDNRESISARGISALTLIFKKIYVAQMLLSLK